MGVWARNAFARGWVPDADAVNGPVDGLLRMDNCILDELGVVALRAGSAKINAVALGEPDLHSLYTAALSGTRYRMTGGGGSVYANGTSIQSGMNSTGDIQFGSHLGQIFFARGTSRYKYDGTTVRNWGIAMSGTAPTVAAVTRDYKIFATCDSGESPGFVASEGTIAQNTGKDGTANGAVEMTLDASSYRGAMTKTFAAATDFTSYVGGGVGTDDDEIQFYAYLTEANLLQSIKLDIDINAGDFIDDFYSYTFEPVASGVLGWQSHQQQSAQNALSYPVGTNETEQSRIQALLLQQQLTGITATSSLQNPQWNKITIKRSALARTGETTGKDWNTVKAIRVTVQQTSGGAGVEVRIDDIRIVHAALNGKYKYLYVYVRNDGTYVGKSARSAESSTTVIAGSADVTIPADASRDSQVNEIWVFRRGEGIVAPVRVYQKTGVSGTGAYTIRDSLSDIDALIQNIQLEEDNAVPPGGIISIAGPYYDRLFCLTATGLYPSRKLNPDGFSEGQVIQAADTSETAYWLKQALGGLYIGTSKDIYRLDGTGAELPDGTLEFKKTPLNIDHPPISAACAQEGNLLVFLASDGWRAFNGSSSSPISGETSLLYRGQTRHGVSAVNLTGGRFRATIAKGELVVITPEGSSTTYSTVLYRYVFKTNRWYRHVYSGVNWRCLAREPDGTLIGSDSAGFVRTLDTAATDDAGTAIAVTLWTKVDDGGNAYVRKDPRDVRLQWESGGATASAALHLDGAGSAAITVTGALSAMGITAADISSIAAFKSVQWRITASPSAFRLYGFVLQSVDLPFPFRGRVPESNAGYAGEKVISGLKIRACTLGVSRTITPYLDGVAQTTFAFTSTTDEPDTYIYQFPAAVTATDLSWSVDGDLELYEWEPLVLYQLPVRIKAWERKPLTLSAVRRRFGGFTMQVDTKGAAVTVTPVLDGVDQTTLTTTTDELLGKTLTFDAIVGRDLWCRIAGTTAFVVHSVEPIVLETFPPQWKGTTPRSNFGYVGLKTASAVQLRVCTFAAARVFTPYVDGVAQSAFTVTSGEDDPIDATLALAAPAEGVEWSLHVDGDVELFSWTPLVTTKRPLGVKAWDSGPLDLGMQELAWPREVRLKVIAGADITITPWFDGVAYPSYTHTIGANVNCATVVTIPIGRGYKGRTPRFVITSSAVFYPYWVEFVWRGTQTATEKRLKRVALGLGGEVRG